VQAVWNVWGRREMHTGLWYGNYKERDTLQDTRWKMVEWIGVALDRGHVAG